MITSSDGKTITEYAHLEKGSIRVSTGQFVSAGTVIANMGSSGHSSGRHLHFNVKIKDDIKDPLKFPSNNGLSLLFIDNNNDFAFFESGSYWLHEGKKFYKRTL